MNNFRNNILKAISEGIQKGLDFTLDDFSDSDNDLYISKKKVNSNSLDQEDKELEAAFHKKYGVVNAGDKLYSNFKTNENGELISLGDHKNGEAIAICVIQSNFLPDKEARFLSLNGGNDEAAWGPKMLIDELPQCGKILTSKGLRTTGVIMSSTNDMSVICSLYKDNGEFNEEWLIPNQMLSDLQGWKNTEIMVKNINACYKASHYCYNYSTDGLQSGWYLPAIGELIAILSNAIQYRLSDKIDFPCQSWLSSTQYDKNTACYVWFGDKSIIVDWRDKNSPAYVNPCAHFKISKNFINSK